MSRREGWPSGQYGRTDRGWCYRARRNYLECWSRRLLESHSDRLAGSRAANPTTSPDSDVADDHRGRVYVGAGIDSGPLPFELIDGHLFLLSRGWTRGSLRSGRADGADDAASRPSNTLRGSRPRDQQAPATEELKRIVAARPARPGDDGGGGGGGCGSRPRSPSATASTPRRCSTSTARGSCSASMVRSSSSTSYWRRRRS